MTLSHIELDCPLELVPHTVNVLTIENTAQMNKFCSELCNQTEGEEGLFALFDGDKKLSFSKDVRIVSDLFHISFNDKKAQNSLIAELGALAEQNMLVEFSSLQEKVFAFLDQVNGESDFPVDYNVDVGVTTLLKAFGVHWQDTYDDFLARLVSYVNFCAVLLKVRCMVFINLKTFLDDDQLMMLYREAMHNEICLLLIESTVRDKLLDEKITVIDKDLAEFVV